MSFTTGGYDVKMWSEMRPERFQAHAKWESRTTPLFSRVFAFDGKPEQ